MATFMHSPATSRPVDYLSGTPRAHGLDRWIFVIQAALFIVIALVGFIPDSIMKLGMIEAGLRPPFPLVLHAHAVLMGGFLLFLLTQSWWVATGRIAVHQRFGPVGGLIAATLVVVGFILAPSMYGQVAGGLKAAPPPAQEAVRTLLLQLDNILLMQLSAGTLFPVFIAIGLSARHGNPGLHKRMMMIAPAMAIGAAFARMKWLPHTIPASPLSIELYQLMSLAPLFVWDVVRNRRMHAAWSIMLALYIPVAVMVFMVWDQPWWHVLAPRIMGV